VVEMGLFRVFYGLKETGRSFRLVLKQIRFNMMVVGHRPIVDLL
jgi:hypothetical protein